MTKKRILIAYNAGGNRVNDVDFNTQKKIVDFVKSLTGNDLGAFFIYEDGFLSKHINIPLRLD